jgi:hypothetical protein
MTTLAESREQADTPTARFVQHLLAKTAYVVHQPVMLDTAALRDLLNRAAAHGYRYHSQTTDHAGCTVLVFERLTQSRITRRRNR